MQVTKKRYATDNPSWFRLKKLWLKYKISRGIGDILLAQKIAKDIQQCQKDLNVTIANFDELFKIVLWE